MEFIKMHGLGNDYIFVDCLEHALEHPEAIAPKISQRHYSVGSDGLILILPSKVADFKMEMYNADGSRGKMCGNGIRCLGKYVYEHGKTEKKILDVETDAGIRRLNLLTKGTQVLTVRVDMGRPEFLTKKIPVNFNGQRMIQEELEADGVRFFVTCLSLGNPHCVVFVKDTAQFDVGHYGPLLEHHPYFPQRTNVEFAEIVNESKLKMRVWERGSGETLACGTGACAVTAAAVVSGHVRRRAVVQLAGGELMVFWDMTSQHLFMTGPAEEVCTGIWLEKEDVQGEA